MAKKAQLFNDLEAYKAIMMAEDPKEQKKIGRKVKNFDEKVWNVHAKDIVYQGNYYKFTQNKNLKNKLLSTKGTILVEASPFDRVWGIGLDKSNPLVLNRESWRGSNWLGEVLTQVREDLLNDCKFTGIQRKNAKGNA